MTRHLDQPGATPAPGITVPNGSDGGRDRREATAHGRTGRSPLYGALTRIQCDQSLTSRAHRHAEHRGVSRLQDTVGPPLYMGPIGYMGYTIYDAYDLVKGTDTMNADLYAMYRKGLATLRQDYYSRPMLTTPEKYRFFREWLLSDLQELRAQGRDR